MSTAIVTFGTHAHVCMIEFIVFLYVAAGDELPCATCVSCFESDGSNGSPNAALHWNAAQKDPAHGTGPSLLLVAGLRGCRQRERRNCDDVKAVTALHLSRL